MKCPKCGHKNPPNTVFCQKCDTWVLGEFYEEPQPKKEPAPKKKWNLYWVKPAVCAGLILAFLASGIAILLGEIPGDATTAPQLSHTQPTPTASIPGDTLPPMDEPFETLPPVEPTFPAPPESLYQLKLSSGLQYTQSGEKYIFKSGNHITTGVPADKTLNLQNSMDGTRCAFLDEASYLFFVDNDTVKAITSAVTSFAISLDGCTVAYQMVDGTLFLYDVASDRSNGIIIRQVCNVVDYALSPDGKSVAIITDDVEKFATDESESEKAYAMLLYSDGTLHYIDVFDQMPVILGVCNNGKYLYFRSGTQYFSGNINGACTYFGDYGDLLQDDGSGAPMVYLSSDHAQMLYHTGDGTQIALNSNGATELIESHLYPVTPALTALHSNLTAEYGIVSQTFPYHDLTRQLYYTVKNDQDGDQQYHLYTNITKQGSEYTADQYWLDPTGKFLYYIQKGTLLRKDLSGKELPFTLAENVTDFVVAFDCSRVYFVSDGNLWSCDDAGNEPQVIFYDTANMKLSVSRDHILYCKKDADLLAYTPETGFQVILDLCGSIMPAPSGEIFVTQHTTNGQITYCIGPNSELQFIYESSANWYVAIPEN